MSAADRERKQELPSDELVSWGYAPGKYIFHCRDCDGQFWEGDKHAYRCERCAMIARYKAAESKLDALSYLTA